MPFDNEKENRSAEVESPTSRNTGTEAGDATLLDANRAFSGFCGSKVDNNPSFMEEVGRVLTSDTADDAAEAKEVIRGMVTDLLSENDALRRAVSMSQKTIRQIIITMNAQNNHMENAEQSNVLQASLERNCGKVVISLESDKVQSSPLEAASNAVIQGLTNKIESLTAENALLEHELICTRECMEDLESLNEARLHTIDALEKQFMSMHQKSRQRYQQKLRNGPSRQASSDKHHNRSPLSPLNIPASPSNTCMTSPPSSNCTKSSQGMVEELYAFGDFIQGIGASIGEI